MKISPQLKMYQIENNRICKIFAARFKELKNEYELTLPVIADILGISRQSIIYYTMGNRIPSIPIIIGIATMFNTTVDYLLGLTDKRG